MMKKMRFQSSSGKGYFWINVLVQVMGWAWLAGALNGSGVFAAGRTHGRPVSQSFQHHSMQTEAQRKVVERAVSAF